MMTMIITDLDDLALVGVMVLSHEHYSTSQSRHGELPNHKFGHPYMFGFIYLTIGVFHTLLVA
jgi:hypothetical protein